MKNLILSTFVVLALTLTGCAITDQVLLKRHVDPVTQEPTFIDNITKQRTTNPNDATGKPNTPEYDAAPSAQVSALESLLNAIPGGWGGLVSILLSASVSLYGAVRLKNMKAAAAALKELVDKLRPYVAQLKADWAAGVIDTDKDGVITLAEAADYIKSKTLASFDPQSVMQLVGVFANQMLSDQAREDAITTILQLVAAQPQK